MSLPALLLIATSTVVDTATYDITVVSTRVTQTGGSAHVVRAKELERYEYDDPHAVLATVPGLYTRGEDGVGLRPNIGLRGVNPDRSKKITLLEDGVLFAPAPYSAPAAYYFPLVTRMQTIRVIKGPASVAYGPQTVGGSIDFVTRAISSTSAAALDLAGGAHLYGKAHGYFSWGDGKLGFVVEGVHLREDGFKTLPDQANTGFYRNEWMLKGSYAFDPELESKNELQVKLTYSDERSRETYLGLSDADFARDGLSRYFASELDEMRWHRISGVVSHFVQLSSDVSLRTVAYRHDLARTWRKVNRFRGASLFDVLTAPDDPRNAVYHAILNGEAETTTPDEALLIGPNQRDFISEGVESRLRIDGETGALLHRFEAGARLHYDRVERRHSEDAFQLVGGELIPEGSPTIVTSFNEASTIAGAFHATDAITFSDFTLTPGVRVEALRSTDLDRVAKSRVDRTVVAVLPGAALYWGATRDLGFFAGIHRGFSPPAPGSAETTSPEYSVNLESGVRWASRNLRAELIGFYNDYSNLTDVCTLSSGCLDDDLDRQFDAGEARIYGLEAYVETERDLGGGFKLPFAAAYTFTRTEFLTDFASDDPIFGDVRRGDEIPYVPRHQGRISLGLERAGVAGYVGVTYTSAMREVAGREALEETIATDPQLIVDLGGSLPIVEGVKLYAIVKNVLDERAIVSRRPYGARPNAPRWVQIGIKLATF